MRYMILLAAIFAVYALLIVPPGERLPDWAKTIILLAAIITAYILASDKFDELRALITSGSAVEALSQNERF